MEKDGYVQGKGGSMHMFKKKVNLMGGHGMLVLKYLWGQE